MKTKKNFRGLSGLDLKCLAMVLMVLDHLHYFFEFTGTGYGLWTGGKNRTK